MFRFRALTLALAGLVAAAGALLGAGCDGSSSSPPPDAVAWIDGLGSGLAAAAARGTPALVYLRRLEPASEADADLRERVFAREESRALSDRFVAIRLTLGDAATPPPADLVRRFGVRTYPALFVLNARGHVLARDVAPNLAQMIAALEAAQAADSDFAEVEPAGDDAARVRRARELIRRGVPDEAVVILTEIIAREPSAVALEALADAYAARYEAESARATLTRLIRDFPDDVARTRWRVRLATLDLARPMRARKEWVSRLDAAVEALRGVLRDLGDSAPAEARADVHAELGRRLSQTGDHVAALAHVDWVLEHAPESPAASRALVEKGNVRFRQGDFAAARECFVQVLERFPQCPDAERVPAAIRNCDARLGR